MSAICTEKWKTLPDEQWQKIEQVRLGMPRNRRPSKKAVEILVVALAWRFIDEKGYVDSTIDQILADCKSLSRDRVEVSLSCLSEAGVLITVRRSTQGLKGQPGRAPRRVFSFYNPKNLKDVRDQQMLSAVVPGAVIPVQVLPVAVPPFLWKCACAQHDTILVQRHLRDILDLSVC